MTIKLLNAADTISLETYLNPYKSECMFIYSNFKEAGIEYRGEHYQGQYFGSYDHLGRINGVIAHYWNGNIIIHAYDELTIEKLVEYLKNNATRLMNGILGPNAQAECLIQNLELSKEHFSINRSEGLYEMILDDVDTLNIPNDYSVVRADEIPKEVLIEWMKSYDIEALNITDSKTTEEEVEFRLKKGDSWILQLNDIPVSLSSFNARLDDMVQVGPVWTPPEYRNNGFARILLAYTLIQERQRGVKKAILFTDLPAAIKAYIAIGFKKIGDYRLALLQQPINLSIQG